ncbi:MAG: hypothetical protein K6A05_01230 [Lachnospiraceae bacterium]|nr:hypothetical protein [Lachnospiraceae bacterium]
MKMIHMAMLLAAEEGSFAEEWAELVEVWHEVVALYTSKEFLVALLWIVLLVVFWRFLYKTGVLTSKKKKAEMQGRTITAHYIDDVPQEVFRGEVDAGDIRMFRYNYTHPLTGKPEQFELDFAKKGAPPLQLTLYYSGSGKVFDGEKESSPSTFWMIFGIIVSMGMCTLLFVAFGLV